MRPVFIIRKHPQLDLEWIEGVYYQEEEAMSDKIDNVDFDSLDLLEALNVLYNNTIGFQLASRREGKKGIFLYLDLTEFPAASTLQRFLLSGDDFEEVVFRALNFVVDNQNKNWRDEFEPSENRYWISGNLIFVHH